MPRRVCVYIHAALYSKVIVAAECAEPRLQGSPDSSLSPSLSFWQSDAPPHPTSDPTLDIFVSFFPLTTSPSLSVCASHRERLFSMAGMGRQMAHTIPRFNL